MRLYTAPEGPAQSIHHAFARIYLRNSPNGGVYKATLYGHSVDMILAASAMVDSHIGIRAVVVDANTTHGVTARRLMKSGQMTHRRAVLRLAAEMLDRFDDGEDHSRYLEDTADEIEEMYLTVEPTGMRDVWEAHYDGYCWTVSGYHANEGDAMEAARADLANNHNREQVK